MVQWVLALVVTVTSLIGPRPCCCTLAIGHVHAESADPIEKCCCGQNEHQGEHETKIATLNDEPNVSTPPHRCHCDHSAIADPMTVSKSTSEIQQTLAQQIELADFVFQPVTICSFGNFTSTEWHGPTGRALLRALHLMRC